jgi:hypothetical protein
MKVNVKNLLLILFAMSVPLSSAICQEKKSEKKIKVIIDDGSGVKTVIDTTFTNGPLPDSVILKGGKVIYFTGSGDEILTEKSPKNRLVTVTTTGNDEKSREKTIIITSDDATRTSKAEGDGDKDSDILEKLEKNDSETEMTKYVIAKDGVVVTVESNDETKAKDIIKVIENKLDVKSDDSEKKVVVKTETKKTVKK